MSALKKNQISEIKNVLIKGCELLNVNPRSVTLRIMYSGETHDVFATRKIANELLQSLRANGITELNKFFIVKKNDKYGAPITWLAMPSIFG